MAGIKHDPNALHEWEVIGDVMVTRTMSGEIPVEPWKAFVKDLHEAKITKLFALVVGSAAINATQRKDAADAFRSKGVHTTVVSDDRMVRGVITALSWLGANIKPFAWSDLDKAFTNLDASGPPGERIRAIARRCEKERQ